MNKWDCLRKFGAALSGGVVLSSVVMPSLIAKADGFSFTEIKELNAECNASWLFYFFYIFRFDFVKRFVLERITKQIVCRNFRKIKEIIEDNGLCSESSFVCVGADKVRISFTYNKRICTMFILRDSADDNKGGCLVITDDLFKNKSNKDEEEVEACALRLSINGIKNDYQSSTKALRFLEMNVLAMKLFDLLFVKSGVLPNEKKMNGPYSPNTSINFDFSGKNITLGDGEKVVSIEFWFCEREPTPYFLVQYSGKPCCDFSAGLSLVEINNLFQQIDKALSGENKENQNFTEQSN